jgi:hypothetical protein
VPPGRQTWLTKWDIGSHKQYFHRALQPCNSPLMEIFFLFIPSVLPTTDCVRTVLRCLFSISSLSVREYYLETPVRFLSFYWGNPGLPSIICYSSPQGIN